MNRLILLFVFLITLLVFSCRSKNENVKLSYLSVDDCENRDTFFIEDHFDPNIVFFNSINDIFLNNIGYIYVEDKIIIFDNSQGKLFSSDKNGKDLIDITQKGKGPGEYPFISSVFVDDYMYVSSGPMFNIYDSNNFNFLESKESIELQSNNFVIVDSVMYSSYGINFNNLFHELSYYNFKTGEYKHILPFLGNANNVDERQFAMMGQFLTINEEKEVLFSRKFENIIYSLKDAEYSEKYKIKLENSPDYIVPVNNRYMNNQPKYTMDRFFETKDNLYINIFIRDGKMMYFGILVHNKDRNKDILYKNIWSEKIRSRIELLQMSNGKLLGYINSAQVNYLKKEAEKILNNSNANISDQEWAFYIAENIGNQVNPILFILEEN